MTRSEIRHFVEQQLKQGLTLTQAINELLLQLKLTDISDPVLWYQQRIGGE